MNKVLILEGPDCSGKSTLAKQLATFNGFEYRHLGRPKPNEDVFRTYTLELWRALKSPNPVVFDRLYLGETIYGPVMRGGSLLSPLQRLLIERLMAANDVKQVVCLPNFEVCRDKWRERLGQEYVQLEPQLKKIWDGYSRVLSWPQYDYTRQDPDFVARVLMPRPTLPSNVLGSPDAKLLIVGEQVNTRKTVTDWAFFAYDSSSGYLNEALMHSQIPESDLAFCNAIKVNNQPRDLLEVLFRLPKFVRAIALGRRAEEACRKQQVPHVQLPHPSYWKRFKHANMAIYADLFRVAHEEAVNGLPSTFEEASCRTTQL